MQWGAHRGRRIILPREVDETDVEDCASLMNATKVRDTTALVEIGLTREVTWRVVNDYYLHFGKEYPFGINFVFASGPEEPEVGELTAMLSEYFEPPTDDELLSAVDSSTSVEQRRENLTRLGVGASTVEDPRYLEKIVEAMRSGDERVREAGLWAALWALWPQILPEIDSMNKNDANPVLRDQAGALAGWMRREGITP